MADNNGDLARTVFAVLFLGGLIATSFLILLPFIAPVLWAATIVIATWPVLLRLQGYLFGRRSLAILVMTIALLLVVVLPVTLAVGTLAVHAETLLGWAGVVGQWRLSPPPDWLRKVPLAGEQVAGLWQQVTMLSDSELLNRATPYAKGFLAWLLAQLGSLGFVLVQFLMTVVIAAILYAKGDEAAAFMMRFASRLAGQRGEGALHLAGRAVRGVALGVVGTAILQSILAGIGLTIASVPFASLLMAVVFILSIAQLGPVFVLGPAVVWVYSTGATGMAIFLLGWAVIVGISDNFVRPLLIQRGADLSLLLIFAGVVGGLLTMGIIGIFVGPVVLAVSWTLLDAWVGPAPSGDESTAESKPA